MPGKKGGTTDAQLVRPFVWMELRISSGGVFFRCCVMGFLSKLYSPEQIRPYFDRTKSRGPDDTRIEAIPGGLLCFHRLAIMGLHDEGMQPFSRGKNKVVCNGELYGWRPVRRELEAKGYVFQSDSDCELLLPLYE